MTHTFQSMILTVSLLLKPIPQITLSMKSNGSPRRGVPTFKSNCIVNKVQMGHIHVIQIYKEDQLRLTNWSIVPWLTVKQLPCFSRKSKWLKNCLLQNEQGAILEQTLQVRDQPKSILIPGGEGRVDSGHFVVKMGHTSSAANCFLSQLITSYLPWPAVTWPADRDP